jgi:hypothetical protein
MNEMQGRETEQIPDKISVYKTTFIHFRNLRMEATGSSETVVII